MTERKSVQCSQNRYDEGCRLTHAGKLQEAVRAFSSVIDCNAGWAEAYFRRGCAIICFAIATWRHTTWMPPPCSVVETLNYGADLIFRNSTIPMRNRHYRPEEASIGFFHDAFESRKET